MKKIYLRAALIALILTAAVGLLVWYSTMRREVPDHARVIPADAFAVVTVNLREMAIDRRGNDHLFPEMSDESLLQKEFSPFMNALERTGATGVEETADILLFAYHSGDAAFFGAAFQLEDSTSFSELIRTELSRGYKIQPLTNHGVPVVQFDTTAAILGWTNDVALLLYPIGNHSVPVVSQQCIQLLKQPAEKSVLSNEAFRAHELKSFTVGLWFQSASFLRFTGGGALAEQLTADVDYFNYFADFEAGEILIRSEWQVKNDARVKTLEEVPFPSEAKHVLGFTRHSLRTDNDSLAHVYADSPLMADLPLNDEECIQLLPYLNGHCISVVHDSLRHSTSFALADPAGARDLLNIIMSRDSIPLTNRGWVYDNNGVETRLILTEKLLTVTSSPEADGRTHPVPAQLSGFMLWYDLPKFFEQKHPGMIGLFIPDQDAAYALFAKNLVSLTSTIPVQVGKMRRSEITLKFADANINSLIQVEDLLRKIYFPLK